ncbi:uncharacterized protein [Anas acuta]|uniref:uncharacterized protein n=1 Tax=Anas acuta TaxID=28680 RepID=UPI0035C938E0
MLNLSDREEARTSLVAQSTSSSFPASLLYEWPMSDAENAQWREKHRPYPPNIHQPSQRLCLHLWLTHVFESSVPRTAPCSMSNRCLRLWIWRSGVPQGTFGAERSKFASWRKKVMRKGMPGGASKCQHPPHWRILLTERQEVEISVNVTSRQEQRPSYQPWEPLKGSHHPLETDGATLEHPTPSFCQKASPPRLERLRAPKKRWCILYCPSLGHSQSLAARQTEPSFLLLPAQQGAQIRANQKEKRRAEHPSRETPPNCSLLGSQHPTERGSSRELLSCRSWDQPSGEEDEEQHAEQCPEVEDDRGYESTQLHSTFGSKLMVLQHVSKELQVQHLMGMPQMPPGLRRSTIIPFR